MALKHYNCKKCGKEFTETGKGFFHYCSLCRSNRILIKKAFKLQLDPTELGQALATLAFYNGDAEKASTRLEQDGVYVTQEDLLKYRVDYEEKYIECSNQFEKAKEDAIVVLAREGAADALKASNMVVNENKVAMVHEQSPSRAALNLSKIAVNNANLMLTLQGRPSKFTAQETPHQLLKTLEALGVARKVEEDEVVEGTFVEVPDEVENNGAEQRD